jgi:hypothetical protein
MSKKLILACMAIAAFAAFVLPATASASPRLCETAVGGEPCANVEVGHKLTGTNVGVTKFKEDGGFNLTLAECTTVVLTGELTQNTGTSIEGTVSTATFAGTGSELNGMKECSGLGNLTPTTNGGGVDGENVTNGTPWCVRANNTMNADEFQVRGGACGGGARAITFILHSTTSGECKYERTTTTGPVKGTFQTDTETGKDAVLSVAPGANTTFKGETGNPASCPANGTLEMSFTLETDSANVEPLYIK